jgi:hypothetical protein
VKSNTTTEFRKLFAGLPKQVQEQTRAAYRQFKEDPSYPSLRFKKVHPKLPIYKALSKAHLIHGWDVALALLSAVILSLEPGCIFGL